jgi:hypothetical protein
MCVRNVDGVMYFDVVPFCESMFLTYYCLLAHVVENDRGPCRRPSPGLDQETSMCVDNGHGYTF